MGNVRVLQESAPKIPNVPSLSKHATLQHEALDDFTGGVVRQFCKTKLLSTDHGYAGCSAIASKWRHPNNSVMSCGVAHFGL
jgi:hypothetical protein